MTLFFLAIIGFSLIELLYFKIANHYNIIDHPNLRSSHSKITLRGGGIIFPIALIIGVTIWQTALGYFAFGLGLISLISFLDDIITLKNKIRISIHLIAVTLLLWNLNLSQTIINPYSLYLIPLAYILIIGIINAYNFMDGINGITVSYSLLSILSIYFTQYVLDIFLFAQNVWLMLIASLLVFAYFNFRKKAKAFAGDVGSISMAFIISFLIVLLFYKTNNPKWILLLGIYGLDTVSTIFCRIVRKENIFQAHRSHFFQFLANEKKWSHLLISLLYVGVQCFLNILIIYGKNDLLVLSCFLGITIIFIAARWIFEGKNKLFKVYN